MPNPVILVIYGEGHDYTAVPAIARRAAAAAGRQPPRRTRSQNSDAPDDDLDRQADPAADRAEPEVDAEQPASGGVVNHEVTMPTIAAYRTSLAPRSTPRAITFAASATRNARLTWTSMVARSASAASPGTSLA